MKVLLQNVRLAFPALFEAKTVNGEGKPAFSAALILDENSTAVCEVGKGRAKAVLDKAIDAVAAERWKDKAPAMLKAMRAGDKLALHDGDLKAQYDGFPDHFYVSARGYSRPLVIDADKSPLTEADGKVYAGCYVDASIDLWPQDNNYGKRINAGLKGIQFRADGDAFSGSAPADPDDFENLAVPAEADDLV